MVDNAINLLGKKATDKVTGFSGVIASVSFDLYGCVQVVLTPPVDADGKTREAHWFDVQRLDVEDERVLPVPAFRARNDEPKAYDRGPCEKPRMESTPLP